MKQKKIETFLHKNVIKNWDIFTKNSQKKAYIKYALVQKDSTINL